MNKLLHTTLLALTLMTASSLHVWAEPLSEKESKHLLALHDEVQGAFKAGDADKVFAMTHPVIYQLTDGKENALAITRTGIEEARKQGFKVLGWSNTAPDRTWNWKNGKMCIIPHTLTVEIGGAKLKSVGFMIAIKGNGETEWRFLDGAGLVNNPQLLDVLLPGLPDDLELPSQTTEEIE